MSVLNRAPKVTQFVEAWSQRFERAVKDAAGRDGRLSLNEARSIAERDDGLRLWADNAVNYLESKGQQTVSVRKLLGAAERYAFASATRIAGSNQQISLLEARLLPPDLVDDFFMLRGQRAAEVDPLAQPAAPRIEVHAEPPITASVDGDSITLRGNGAAFGTLVTIRFDDHEVEVKKAHRGFLAYDLCDRMPEGYSAEEIRTPDLDPTTVRITRDPPTAPTTAEALILAREGLAEYLRNERIDDRDWSEYYSSNWDTLVAGGILDEIARFGAPGASAVDVSRRPDMYVFCGRGPNQLYTEVCVDKTSRKVTRAYVEID
ncbi:MAG: hypothetical protein ABIJ09_23560 [Pseudomonadota bacterium]